MPTREEIRIQINGDANVRRAFAVVERGLEGMRRSIFTVRNVLGGLLAAVGVGGVAVTGAAALRDIDVLDKLGDRLGITVEALSELQFVAEQRGIDFRTLTTGLQRAIRRISEAAKATREARSESDDLADSLRGVVSGTDATSAALKEMGLDAQDLLELAPDEVFERLADALSAIPSQYDRVRLAQKLFDSEGVALVQIMNQGSEGIRELRNEARLLGLTMSTQAAAGVAAANDSMSRFRGLIRGIRDQTVAALAPTLEAINDLATEYIQSLIQARGGARDLAADVADSFISGLDSFITGAIDVINILRTELGSLINLSRIIRQLREDLAPGPDRRRPIEELTAAQLRQRRAQQQRELQALEEGRIVDVPEVNRIAQLSDSATPDFVIQQGIEARRKAIAAIEAELAVVVPTKIDPGPIIAGLDAIRQRSEDIRNDVSDTTPPALFDGIEQGAASANDTLANLAKEIRRTRDLINAPTAQDSGDVNTLDFAAGLTRARDAFQAGDLDAAVTEAGRANELIRQMAQAGTQSDLVLGGLTRQLENLTRNIAETGQQDLTLTAELNTETAAGQLSAFLDTVRNNPVRIPVELASIGDFAPGQGIFPAGQEPAGVFPSLKEAALAFGAR